MPRHKSKEYWLTALIEEVGEVARAIQDEGNTEYMAELIQVAGVAVAAVVDLQCSRELKNV
jgi:NTP pyrophosphatase (non-canonical NTP hydrolase)